ncbi:hypothetical protein ACFONN_02295 [Dyella humi]|uniref:Uncharacterized protein n=1 Tax=Dyella humi TaxID=1770547 RepID=A0ABW8IGY9_9GAMM
MKVKARSYIHDRLFGESIHAGLTVGDIYHVVGISDDRFRIINDNGDPVLYERGIFDIVDPSVPQNWVAQWFDDDGEKYCYIDPPGFGKPGFYEDYFDGVEYAVERFFAYCKQEGLPCRLPKNKKI